MNEEKILKALGNFRKEIDKIYEPKTPKLPKDMDSIYDCDIYIWRHPGMGNSMQIITGNPISIHTATASYLESLLRQNLLDEEQLLELVKMVIKAANGKL